MTDRRHSTLRPAPRAPLLPALARQAARDMQRPTKAMNDGARAVASWFAVNGDPFDAVPADTLTRDLSDKRHADEPRISSLSTTDLLAQLFNALVELDTRLDAQVDRDDV